MTAGIRHLSNSELGRLLGLSPSGASKLRNANVLPGPETMRAIVFELGDRWDGGPDGKTNLWDALNQAQIAAKHDGEPGRQQWTLLLEKLTTVPVVEEQQAS